MKKNAEPDQIPQFTDHSTKSYFNISDMVNTRGEILDPNVVSSTTGGTISSDKEKIFEGTDTSSSTNRKNNNNGRVGILESSMISKLTHEPTSGPKSILEIDSVLRQRNSSDSADKINYSKNSGSSSDATSETPSFHGYSSSEILDDDSCLDPETGEGKSLFSTIQRELSNYSTIQLSTKNSDAASRISGSGCIAISRTELSELLSSRMKESLQELSGTPKKKKEQKARARGPVKLHNARDVLDWGSLAHRRSAKSSSLESSLKPIELYDSEKISTFLKKTKDSSLEEGGVFKYLTSPVSQDAQTHSPATKLGHDGELAFVWPAPAAECSRASSFPSSHNPTTLSTEKAEWVDEFASQPAAGELYKITNLTSGGKGTTLRPASGGPLRSVSPPPTITNSPAPRTAEASGPLPPSALGGEGCTTLSW